MNNNAETNSSGNDLVRYSRAGDAFHYRWAARRCLKMLHPRTELTSIVIEGVQEKEKAGEYVVDVAEYYTNQTKSQEKVVYSQLKHTTVRNDTPFKLSDLKNTIEGFANRFSQFHSGKLPPIQSIAFQFVSNRIVAETVKDRFRDFADGKKVHKKFENTLVKYTKLSKSLLRKFCKTVVFADLEGDFQSQYYSLTGEVGEIIASNKGQSQIDTLIAMVNEKALPRNDGRIVRQDVLLRFGASSPTDLYPAPSELSPLPNLIPREQHNEILSQLEQSTTPTIIHADGGVGKTIFAQQTSSRFLSTLKYWFTGVHLFYSYEFSTLTTTPFERSSLSSFGTSSYKIDCLGLVLKKMHSCIVRGLVCQSLVTPPCCTALTNRQLYQLLSHLPTHQANPV